jgi:ribonuclease HI
MATRTQYIRGVAVIIFVGAARRQDQEDSMKIIIACTDGSCLGNPGPGGWAFILKYGDRVRRESGHEDHTTNGRMELMAVIKALEALKEPCQVQLYSDAQYVVKGINEWLAMWKRRNWRKSNKTKVENMDLWQKIDALLQIHTVEAIWVRGHDGNPLNEEVDCMAQSACHK